MACFSNSWPSRIQPLREESTERLFRQVRNLLTHLRSSELQSSRRHYKACCQFGRTTCTQSNGTYRAQLSFAARAISAGSTLNLDVAILKRRSHSQREEVNAENEVSVLPCGPSFGSLSPDSIVLGRKAFVVCLHHVLAFVFWDGCEVVLPTPRQC